MYRLSISVNDVIRAVSATALAAARTFPMRSRSLLSPTSLRLDPSFDMSDELYSGIRASPPWTLPRPLPGALSPWAPPRAPPRAPPSAPAPPPPPPGESSISFHTDGAFRSNLYTR